MAKTSKDDHIFINCPFDTSYTEIFNAIIFTITHCGFYVRCALEESDSSANRLYKIMDIISECRYSIHDISRTEPDPITLLPRFNMPLELGIFIGSKKFGNKSHQTKQCLILDSEPYRYQKFISDIAGQDIEYHHNDVKKVTTCIRDWLATKKGGGHLCSGSIIHDDYLEYQKELPDLCTKWKLDIGELKFVDINFIVNEWCTIRTAL